MSSTRLRVLFPAALRSARGRRPSAIAGALAVLIVTSVLTVTVVLPAIATAATPATLQTVLTLADGTGPFDATAGPGRDTGPANGIVRTNDTVTYNVEIRAEGAPSNNTTFRLALPRGIEVVGLPPYCKSGSSLTPATLPAPVVPLTATSYQALPQQVLVCNVGSRGAASTFTYPVSARVRSEVPDGTVEGPTVATVHSDEVVTPVSSDPVSVSISAAPKWDLSKNSVAIQPDSGYFFSRSHACAFDASRYCFFYNFAVLLSAPSGGKGAEPLTGPISFTDNLTPDSLYGAGTTASPAWIAAGAGALSKYGARLISCSSGQQPNAPGNKIGVGGGSAVNAVRNSGTLTCSQPGPGSAVNVSVTGADTSLYTYPSAALVPPNALAGGRAYAVSSTLRFDVPVDAISDLGIASGGSKSLQMVNRFENLQATGIDGAANPASADDPTNNFRTINARLTVPGGFDKAYSGVPGAASNTPASSYTPTWQAWEGPPGGHIRRSGSITVAPVQTVLSSLVLLGSDLSNPQPGSAVACDAWDNSLLHLAAGQYPANNLIANRVPSGGSAAWISGALLGNGSLATTAAQLPANQVQYSTGVGGPGAASTCSTGTWFDSPDLVPGNDPTLAAQGVFTAVSRVRIWTAMPFPAAGIGDRTQVYASIGLQVDSAVAAGTILPNWAGVRFHFGSVESLTANLANSRNSWARSTYNPANNSGSLGDRLIAAPAFSRITKLVKGPSDATFTASVPAVTGGDTVDYLLSPTLTTSAPTAPVPLPVSVEDCLPAGQQYTDATLTPQVIAQGSPPGAGLACPADATYLRWDLGARPPNAVIAPIDITVRVSPVLDSGVYTNNTLVSAQDDASTPAQRSAHAQIQVVQPAGVAIDKRALTPTVEVNRAAETKPASLKWQIDLANLNAPGDLSRVDVIDTLPRTGLGSSSFHGGLAFSDASLTAGGPTTRILYTQAAAFSGDASDPTNGSGGSTVWCTAPAGGTVASGNGTATDCPSAASQVTGLRVQRPGVFAPGDRLTVLVTLIPSANAASDVYDNAAFGRVGGLALPVGPVDAPETIVASTIGDFVWIDANSNGIQDTGETGLPNFLVRLSGVDSDGNAVTASTSTDTSGHYSFAGLQSGSYTVTFAPSGLAQGQTFTAQTVGADRAVDSNGDANTGVAAAVDLGVDTADLTIDQGVIASGVVNPPTPPASSTAVNPPPPPTSGAGSTSTPPSSVTNLPFTGTAAVVGGLFAALLLGLGVLLTAAGRRRRFR
jgi:hypothetical protein